MRGMQFVQAPSRCIAFLVLLPLTVDAFCPTRTAPSTIRVAPPSFQHYPRQTTFRAKSSSDDSSTDFDADAAQVMDELLKDGNNLRKAVRHFRNNPDIDITRDRWQKVFDAIEVRTAEAEENTVNTRAMAEYPPTSPARMDMTDMYQTLQDQGHLQVYGAISKSAPPAAGSHIVTPTLLERITDLSMTALTPKPTNNLLYAGIALAIIEGIASVATGINLNFLVLTTLLLAFLDKLLLNGAVFESILKVFMPGIQDKILKHEAGHFLTAYLMGCPVEGCVLNAWAALQDARFGGRRTGVSAGTSFFDPVLSKQINTSVVTRSSIDRYSVIVMGGIAAEAINFGRADGGAGDEAALVAFLRQLNGGGRKTNGILPPWNEQSIRNQARWGAMQAVLMLRQYKPCYDALVGALEKGGNLGDCIYAIEKAAQDNNLGPLKEPLGYILDEGQYGEWTTDKPKDAVLGPYSQMILQEEEAESSFEEQTAAASTAPSSADTQETLREYKEIMQDKLRDIDERLKKIES